uniref:APAF1 interacting protein n=1 Tax=Esox lucius TaxID=8010 RepID=A0AAY5L869_ESOLU
RTRNSEETGEFLCGMFSTCSSASQAVIHTHSKAAVMATLFYPAKEFRITHQEMIKGICPAPESNNPEEQDLKERMALAMEQYPDSCAVLVRRHGVYVWGESWEIVDQNVSRRKTCKLYTLSCMLKIVINALHPEMSWLTEIRSCSLSS